MGLVFLKNGTIPLGSCTIRIFSVGDAGLLSVVHTLTTTVEEGDPEPELVRKDTFYLEITIIVYVSLIGILIIPVLACSICWCRDRKANALSSERASQLQEPLAE
jgi:hypothetical protein